MFIYILHFSTLFFNTIQTKKSNSNESNTNLNLNPLVIQEYVLRVECGQTLQTTALYKLWLNETFQETYLVLIYNCNNTQISEASKEYKNGI